MGTRYRNLIITEMTEQTKRMFERSYWTLVCLDEHYGGVACLDHISKVSQSAIRRLLAL